MKEEKFWDRFLACCEERGLAPTGAMRKMGISSGNITRWKLGSGPTNEMLVTVSDFFHRSTDYFLKGEDFPVANGNICHDSTERAVLEYFRALSPELKSTALIYLKGLSDAYRITTKQESQQEEPQQEEPQQTEKLQIS